MSQKGEELGGCLFGAACIVGFLWFATAPSDDQVCRQRAILIADSLHGVDWQPTCQSLFDRLDSEADEARTKNRELEERVEALERRLNL